MYIVHMHPQGPKHIDILVLKATCTVFTDHFSVYFDFVNL